MKEPTNENLLLIIFNHMYPTVKFIDAFSPGDRPPGIVAGFLHLIDKRAKKKYLEPVVVFSFDTLHSIESALDERDKFILEQDRGVFYLHLPDTPEHIHQVVNKAIEMQGNVPLEKGLYAESYRRRQSNLFSTNFKALKHEFDNVFLSLKAKVGQAKGKLQHNPTENFKALMEVKKEPIEHLAEKFRRLSSSTPLNGDDSLEQIDGMFQEAAILIEKISMKNTKPADALQIADICVGKLRKVDEILMVVRALI